MSYLVRRGMGDGPITDPSQLDGQTIATVTPTQVTCDQLPADALARQPGQVCAPAPATAPTAPASGSGVMGWLVDLINQNVAAAPTTPAASDGMSDTTKLLLGAAAVAGIYYYSKRKKH